MNTLELTEEQKESRQNYMLSKIHESKRSNVSKAIEIVDLIGGSVEDVLDHRFGYDDGEPPKGSEW